MKKRLLALAAASLFALVALMGPGASTASAARGVDWESNNSNRGTDWE